jgi:hypothetical protein
MFHRSHEVILHFQTASRFDDLFVDDHPYDPLPRDEAF